MLCENCGTRVSETDITCPVCGVQIERDSANNQDIVKKLNIEDAPKNKRRIVFISMFIIGCLTAVVSIFALIINVSNSGSSETSNKQVCVAPQIIRAQTINGIELGNSNVESSRTFDANNAIDANDETCWCVNTEKRGGEGAEIAFILKEQTTVRRIGLVNGNQFHAYDELYSLNGQICEFVLTFSDGSKQTFCADFNSGEPEKYQYFDIEPCVTGSIVLTVISAYEGTKYSTNVSITEFIVF